MEKLLLKRGVSLADVAQAMRAAGLSLTREGSNYELAFQIWRAGDKLVARYDECDLVGLATLHVDGTNERKIASKLRKALPHWERGRILEGALAALDRATEAEPDEEGAREWAFLISTDLAFRGFSALSVAVLRAFLGSVNPHMRREGARGLRFLPRPEYRGVARLLLDHQDPEVVKLGEEMAARLLELHGPGEGEASDKQARSVHSMLAVTSAYELMGSNAAWERELGERLSALVTAQGIEDGAAVAG